MRVHTHVSMCVSVCVCACVRVCVRVRANLCARVCVCVQKSEAKSSEESRALRKQKQALEVDLQLMKKERDLLKAQVLSASGAASHT